MSVTLHVSGNWKLNTSLSTLEKSLAENGSGHKFWSPKTMLPLGHFSSFSRHSICRARIPLLQERNFKIIQMMSSPNGSWRSKRETLFHFLTSVDTTNMRAVALVSTLKVSTEGDIACAYQPVENPPVISQLLSQYHTFVWMASL